MRTALALLCAGSMVCFAASAFAADHKAGPEKPGELINVMATITKITPNGKNKEIGTLAVAITKEKVAGSTNATIIADAQTKVFVGDTQKAFSDLKATDRIQLSYRKTADGNVAAFIRVVAPDAAGAMGGKPK